ncbi:hypothetical protein [Craterilacuibacter sinensis]|uniref:Uncharacterized protein n=1 Tax=Craterilacuibacter sinensis TaxID=2686017 RepID=A0A845BR60_9NEIS|nr:hypothetical protein [Craterilacuibacter sinensis]MXR36961.1 hypothetical protein [Craterilacuibacter sinensis]
MKKLVWIVFVSAWCHAEAAPRWVLLGETASGNQITFDLETFRSGALPELWLQVDQASCPPKGRRQDCLLQQKIKVNCNSQEFAVVHTRVRNHQGSLRHDSGLVGAKFESAPQGSIAASVVALACHVEGLAG